MVCFAAYLVYRFFLFVVGKDNSNSVDIQCKVCTGMLMVVWMLIFQQVLAAVGELLMCERVPRNAVYTSCGSKDRQLLDTEKVITRMPWVVTIQWTGLLDS